MAFKFELNGRPLDVIDDDSGFQLGEVALFLVSLEAQDVIAGRGRM